MQLCGLRGDSTACQAGGDWIAAQVRAGQRTLTLADIDGGVASLGLREEEPWTAISIATLKPDRLAADAVHALDWVDRFDGAGPYEKRQPLSPATWRQLQADVEAIPSHFPPEDVSPLPAVCGRRLRSPWAPPSEESMDSRSELNNAANCGPRPRYETPMAPVNAPARSGRGAISRSPSG